MDLLSFESVTVRYGADTRNIPVLDRASLNISLGEVVVVVGARFVGKTALLRVAAGVELPQKGEVRVCGLPLTGVSGAKRARHARSVGYVPKRLKLAAGRRVLDFVVLPLLAEGVPVSTARARAYEVLDRVDAGDAGRARPEDLDAGLQARVLLARALVRRPSLLLLDEPASAAQASERDALLELLQSLLREHAGLAMLITARPGTETMRGARVLTLAEGSLRSEGVAGRVVAFPGTSSRWAADPV